MFHVHSVWIDNDRHMVYGLMIIVFLKVIHYEIGILKKKARQGQCCLSWKILNYFSFPQPSQLKSKKLVWVPGSRSWPGPCAEDFACLVKPQLFTKCLESMSLVSCVCDFEAGWTLDMQMSNDKNSCDTTYLLTCFVFSVQSVWVSRVMMRKLNLSSDCWLPHLLSRQHLHVMDHASLHRARGLEDVGLLTRKNRKATDSSFSATIHWLLGGDDARNTSNDARKLIQIHSVVLLKVDEWISTKPRNFRKHPGDVANQ